MRMKIKGLALVVALCLAAAGSALAHHGGAVYDTAHPVTVTGVVTDFEFVNPHSQIYIDVKDAKGEIEQWQGEITAPTKLGRAGWTKHTLKPGDTITMTGSPARSGKHSMAIHELIGPNGKPLPLEVDEHGNPRYGPGE